MGDPFAEFTETQTQAALQSNLAAARTTLGMVSEALADDAQALASGELHNLASQVRGLLQLVAYATAAGYSLTALEDPAAAPGPEIAPANLKQVPCQRYKRTSGAPPVKQPPPGHPPHPVKRNPAGILPASCRNPAGILPRAPVGGAYPAGHGLQRSG